MAADSKGKALDKPQGALTVVLTPHEVVEPKHPPASRRIRKGLAESARIAAEAAEATGKAAKSARKTIGKSASRVAKISARIGGKAAEAAAATVNSVGDLNGDGRFDAEDLRIAKNAAGKVAAEIGGEAASLGKAALRHPLTKDAAAAALVGGAVGAALPLVTVTVGAAAGAALVVAKVGPAAAVEAIGKGAGEAASYAKAKMTSARKPKAKRAAKPKK